MKTLESIADLPSWFNCEKYINQLQLDAGDWWRVLENRYSVIEDYCREDHKLIYSNPKLATDELEAELLKTPRKVCEKLVNQQLRLNNPYWQAETEEERRDLLIRLIRRACQRNPNFQQDTLRKLENEVWADPIPICNPVDSSEDVEEIYDDEIEAKYDELDKRIINIRNGEDKSLKEQLNFTSIRAISVSDYLKNYQYIEDLPELQKLATYRNEYEMPDDVWLDWQILSEYTEWEFKHYDDKTITDIELTLDLKATDKLLVEDFKKFLAAARKNIVPAVGKARQRKFTKSDFVSWASLNILAYIDLTTWAVISNISIPQRIIGEAIYPLDCDADLTERIRKSTKPLADKLLTPFTLEPLYLQVVDADQ
jgi:hypothetical protein